MIVIVVILRLLYLRQREVKRIFICFYVFFFLKNSHVHKIWMGQTVAKGSRGENPNAKEERESKRKAAAC